MTYEDFYKQRINTTYQDYFEKRYKPLLDKIIKLKPKQVIEEGIGIGSISKFLRKHSINSYGYDLNLCMLNLTRKNNPGIVCWLGDILHQPKARRGLAVTHGVLEHFQDEDIKRIFNRYRRHRQTSIHYVPLDKYHTPSFGDERLLSAEYWIKLSNTKEYEVFNDGHDMWFIIK